MERIGPKLSRSQRIEREVWANELAGAAMSADVEYLASGRITLNMESALDGLYAWAKRVVNP